MFSVFLATATAMAPGAASATQPVEEIVVTGQAPLNQEVALRTVTDITVVSNGLQIARYHSPVCPVVGGLPAAAAAAIEDRVRETARKVGAKVAERGCPANLLLFFSDNGGELVRDMRNKRPKWFSGLSKAKVNLIERGEGPVRAWSATSARNDNGQAAEDHPDQGAPAAMRVNGASFLQRQSRLHIDASIIVLDRAAVDGRPLAEIADYAAMRGLAMTKPPENGGVQTILTMFGSAGHDAPHTLTPFDLGYLTALYRGSGGESAVEERNRIARALSS